ncbi:MAG: glycerol-3-phosphate 1-O-acyltransferase PlsY [Clostridia bacterium]|nr:glycerol-3-phosphate 1-O-acyltransferase PlsY [Clostridia bacterium]
MIKMALTVIIGYLFGSISSGVVLSRLAANTDIRTQGSGNAGTTNMLRVLGRRMALFTFLGDMLKGVIAVYIGKALVGGELGGVLGVLGAVLGHNFPVFFGFKGGKGIATSFGSLLFVYPLQALAAFTIFLILVIITHYVSVGSIAAAIALPAFVLLTTPFHPVIWGCMVFLGAMVVWRHHQNISRLLQHKENKLDFNTLRKKKK